MHKFAVSLATAVLGFTLAATSEVAAEPQAAVRPECFGCGESDIEVHYLSPLSYITSETETFDFGTTPVGTPVFFDDFAIGATQGYDNLLISSIDLPTGFSYVWGPNISPDYEAAGASHGTKIQCDAEAPGTYSGNLVINSDDPDEGTFTIALLCEVEALTTDTGGEENGSTPDEGDGGSGAGLPDAGSSTMQVMLLALGLLVVGTGSGLLARRRS